MGGGSMISQTSAPVVVPDESLPDESLPDGSTPDESVPGSGPVLSFGVALVVVVSVLVTVVPEGSSSTPVSSLGHPIARSTAPRTVRFKIVFIMVFISILVID